MRVLHHAPSVKLRVLYAGLLVLALWPLVQIGLVLRFDVSPWKLAGWGMYAEPRFGLVGMEIYGRVSANEAYDQLSSPGAPLRSAAADYLERYKWLRRLAPPDPLAARVFEAYPQWNELRIVVSRPNLNRETAMIELVSSEHRYSRTISRCAGPHVRTGVLSDAVRARVRVRRSSRSTLRCRCR
jgi:hypothetical protein